MATAAERKVRTLTAKKESLFSILQSLYNLSKALNSEAAIKKFQVMSLTLDSTMEGLVSVVDEIHELQLEIKADYVPDYSWLATINELSCYIRMATEQIQKKEVRSSAPPNVATATTREPRLPQLPKIDLPEFSGEIRQWETFHSLYKSMIHDNASLTDLEKIHYLVGRLRGPALGICAGISIIGDNYDIVYKALTDRYENKRVLANTYLQQIFEFRSLNGESERNLNLFLERFDVAVSALKRINLPDLADFILLYQALAKLDNETVRAFEMEFRDSKDIPTYADLINFVQVQSKILYLNKPSTSGSNPALKGRNYSPKDQKIFFAQQGNKKVRCNFCQKIGHYLGRCEPFKALTPSKRYEAVRDNGWCFNCLSAKHGVRDCPVNRVCTQCEKKHHILLHTGKSDLGRGPRNLSISAGETRDESGPREESEVVLCSAMAKNNSTKYTTLLSTVVVEVVNSSVPNRTARFLLDSGSQLNLLTVECCKKLGLKVSKCFSSVQGLGDNTQAVRGVTNLSIASRHNSESTFSISAILVDKITDKLPRYNVDLRAMPDLKGVSLADDKFDQPGEIHGIIGVQLFATILGKNKILGVSGSPIAIQTAFGYVVMGQIPVLGSSSGVFFTLQEEQSLEQLLTRFWEIEQVPKRALVEPEEVACEVIFSNTYSRDNKSGRYSVALPFKNSPESLGDSYKSAKVRLLSLEKRFSRDAMLRTEYNKAMQDFIDQGHMGLLEEENDEGTSYYIAHHPVIKLSSSSTPVRIVLDASAPSDNDVALNDILYSGPKLQADIVTLLLNFRLFKIAVTADIRQMYRQINVIKDHWRYQRLLWRFNPEAEIKIYEIRVVAFGLKASPYLALRTVKQLIKDKGARLPIASKFVSRDLYMDDLCSSVESETCAIQLYNESVKLFSLGGFDLTKWSTNSENLLNYIPVEKRLTNQDVIFKTDTKILGIKWDSQRDILSFRVKVPDEKCTKRLILSAVAKCYDPIGLLAPFIFYLKKIIKELWLLKLGWDEEPPQNIVDTWKKIRSEWGELEKFRVPRHIGASERQPVIILAFSDASLDGYGAVVYLRTTSLNGEINVQLVCSKSKVSSAKSLTIPRLELLAAFLLSNLVKHVLETYKDRIFILKALAFSDSSTVISWLKSPYLKDVFVGNRVEQIKENIPSVLWYHIEGIQNPADCLSRGLTPSQLIGHSMWLQGPLWMGLPEDQWPDFEQNNSDVSSTPEIPQILLLANSINEHPFFELIDKISSWNKILRIMVYVLRFLKLTPQQELISASDNRKAEMVLIKLVQLKHFNSDIERLRINQECSPQLRKLRPFLQDGLLRVGGRIENSNLGFSQKHPLILPAKETLTERLIDFYHKINLHTGASLLDALLRQKYWILGGRSLIRGRVRRCNNCFRLNPTNLTPIMADLPAVRVQEARAFLHTGVDYFGPINITMGRKKNAQVHKAYVSLFICMSVKAIHLELVSSLSTAHFLQAFKRFISRRGPVKILYSDRGTNFVGARTVLKEINEFINSPGYKSSLETELAINNIEWKFNTPRAPHMGGLWESHVKAVKTHIYRVVGDQLLTYEEFSTLLTQIEALLNSRPLCRLIADPVAPEALTPAHFLTLTPLRGFPSESLENIPLNRLDRFQLIDSMIQSFWNRWRLKYLTSLQIRQKWSKCDSNIAVGAVVVLKTDNAPPLHWPLAVVSQIHPGKDGVVRNVTIKTSKGIFTRPVVKICPLPTQ